MAEKKIRTTMSVPAMRKKLGIGKVTAYSLVHKGLFETTIVNKQMRVYVDSFEEWYNHQLKYRKVDGPPPLVEEVTETMTLEEMREELGIPRSTAYQIVAERDEIKHSLIDGAIRVERKDYERWYGHQFRFRKVMGEPPGQAYPASMSPHEMCDLLGIRLRNAGYCLTKRGLFDTFMVDGQLRIDSVSFEKWYKGQTHYKKVKSNIGGSYHGIHRKEEE
jgi:hypothetical protein